MADSVQRMPGMVKRERAWYLFSRDWRQDRKDGRNGLCVDALGPEEPRYQVTYHIYLASGRWLSYTPSIKRVASWTIRETQPVSSVNFRHFSTHLTWEKLPGSPCFTVLQATKSWAEPGYEEPAVTVMGKTGNDYTLTVYPPPLTVIATAVPGGWWLYSVDV